MIPIRGEPPKQCRPWVTLGLIAVNVAIFLYQWHLGAEGAADLLRQKGAVAARLSQSNLLTSYQALKLLPTMFSSLFLHAGWLHLVGNMWVLWLFGEGLEDDLGHWRFLVFYLFCGFFAGIFHVLAAWRLTAPLVGASGAIAGVLGGYLVRRTKAPIQTVVFWRLRPQIRQVPAFVYLLLWLGLQFYGLRQGGPVGWAAHLGGFAIGMLTVNYFLPVNPAAKPQKPKARKRRGGKVKKR
jgi:membrane associated rhomboid family serine protease